MDQPLLERNGASFTGAVLNLSTTIIGAGIMALPATMKVLGLVFGFVSIVLAAILTYFSVWILLRFSHAGGWDSYEAVVNGVFGNYGKIALQACVLVNNVGVLIVYMIIIGDVLSGTTSSGIHHPGVLEGWFGEHWWTGRAFVLLITTLSVLALACFRHMHSLRNVSAFLAFVFLVIMVGITVVKGKSGTMGMPRLFPNVADPHLIWSLFTVVPVLVTAHFNVHNIGRELEDPAQISTVFWTSLALCSFIYIITSVCGFLLFGDSILDDMLANFDTDLGFAFSSQLNDLSRVIYGVHLMLVFPIILYPLQVNLDGLLSLVPLVTDNLRFALMTLGLICVIFLGANFMPSIWVAFRAISAVSIGFAIPALLVFWDTNGIATMVDRILSVFMFFLAVVSSLAAMCSLVYNFKRNVSPLAIIITT